MLHPEIPPGGVTIDDRFGAQRVNAFRRRILPFAREFGVELRIPQRIPCTQRALAMTEYARDQGLLHPLRERLMALHWREGQDIESDDTLRAAAAKVGLEASAALAAADDPAYLDRIDATRRQANEMMVTGIPTVLIKSYPVVGCQRAEVYELVADKVGLRRRATPTPKG